MTTKTYPLLLLTEQSIEFIEHEADLSDSLFYYCNEQTQRIKYLLRDGNAYFLENQCPAELEISSLTTQLQQQLQLDGHCCIAKLSFSSLKELFEFAEQVYSGAKD